MASDNIFAEPGHVVVLRRAHLIRGADRPEALRRILLVIAIGWLPLLLLSLTDTLWHNDLAVMEFLRDVAVHARFILAAPMLIAAEYIALPRLESIRQYFTSASLIDAAKQEQFEIEVRRCRLLSAGAKRSSGIALCAYGISLLLIVFISRGGLPRWQVTSDSYALSLAGWWHALVSLPLILGLILAWLWRLFIWTRFLLAISKLGLRMIAAHPDQAAGLQFIAYSPRVFAWVGLAFGTIVAGTEANQALYRGMSPIDHPAEPIVTALIVTLLFVSPPLIFTRLLLAAWRQGVFKYGDLASRLGNEFEKKWTSSSTIVGPDALADPDFSSTTDLYSIAANVYGMRLILFDYQGAIAIAIAVLLPFVPVWLSVIPMKTLSKAVVNLLF